jgi:hypothetical protein
MDEGAADNALGFGVGRMPEVMVIHPPALEMAIGVALYRGLREG